jgi:hypothetical protein
MGAGDTWWVLAQRHYDDGQWFRALYRWNQQPEVLTARSSARHVHIPPLSDLAVRLPALAPAGWSAAVTKDGDFHPMDTLRPDVQTRPSSADVPDGCYVTLEGDTMFEIARRELGQAALYRELLRLNRHSLPPGANHRSSLPAGLRLVLPKID